MKLIRGIAGDRAQGCTRLRASGGIPPVLHHRCGQLPAPGQRCYSPQAGHTVISTTKRSDRREGTDATRHAGRRIWLAPVVRSRGRRTDHHAGLGLRSLDCGAPEFLAGYAVQRLAGGGAWRARGAPTSKTLRQDGGDSEHRLDAKKKPPEMNPRSKAASADALSSRRGHVEPRACCRKLA